jgi:hypothetical protein
MDECLNGASTNSTGEAVYSYGHPPLVDILRLHGGMTMQEVAVEVAQTVNRWLQQHAPPGVVYEEIQPPFLRFFT